MFSQHYNTSKENLFMVSEICFQPTLFRSGFPQQQLLQNRFCRRVFLLENRTFHIDLLEQKCYISLYSERENMRANLVNLAYTFC